MPTHLHRVQVLLQPEVEAQFRTLARIHRRSHSAMGALLVEIALQNPELQEQLKDAEVNNFLARPKHDPRKRIPQLRTISY